MIKASEFQEALKLDCLVSSTNDTWDFRTPDLNRPGMQFCGFYEFFAFERPQVIGKVEMSYLEKQSPENRRRILEQYLSYNIPCIVICRDLTPPPELLELAERLSHSSFGAYLNAFLSVVSDDSSPKGIVKIEVYDLLVFAVDRLDYGGDAVCQIGDTAHTYSVFIEVPRLGIVPFRKSDN